MTRHPTDLLSLLMGVLSIAAAAMWLVLERGYVDLDQLVWAAPVALVLAGITGVAASLRRP